MNKLVLTNSDILQKAAELVSHIEHTYTLDSGIYRIYGVPRGGIPVAYALASMSTRMMVVNTPEDADFIVDDIIDSGTTKNRYIEKHKKPFFGLYEKSPDNPSWLVFPWEGSEEKSIEDSFQRLFQYIGEDPKREGLLDTPKRMAKAWSFWTQGYHQKVEDIFTTFEEDAEAVDEMVVVKNIPFYSHCEHHLAMIMGTATIGYLPNKKIVGLSKLSRLLDIYARRLQVQERLTTQVANALMTHLDPKGCGVYIKARHMCMESRGICKQGHYTVTSALHGRFKEAAEVRSEFLSICRDSHE